MPACQQSLEFQSHAVPFLPGETSTDFYTGLFSMHRMRVTKLRKFVSRWAHKLRSPQQIALPLSVLPPPPPSPLQYLDANKPPSPSDRYIYKSGEERRVRDTSVPRQRGPLMDEIRAWLDGASRDELKRLPQMLRATQLSAMAEKLEKRLEEIKQGGNCSSV